MKKYKRDWEDAITQNILMFCPLSVRRLLAHAWCLHLTFVVQCLRFFTLTLFTGKLMDLSKFWRSLIIAVSRAIGLRGFNWLINPTFAGHRQR